MQDKDSTRSSINKRMNVVHRCIRTPNIVLRALRYTKYAHLHSSFPGNLENSEVFFFKYSEKSPRKKLPPSAQKLRPVLVTGIRRMYHINRMLYLWFVIYDRNFIT